jgi:hypothetical protein
MPVEIDRKRAIFTYEQLMRHLGPASMLITCPYCEKSPKSFFILMDRAEWSCAFCHLYGKVIWDESHVIFEKVHK